VNCKNRKIHEMISVNFRVKKILRALEKLGGFWKFWIGYGNSNKIFELE
jgi:hypothetical protein